MFILNVNVNFVKKGIAEKRKNLQKKGKRATPQKKTAAEKSKAAEYAGNLLELYPWG